MNLHTELQRKEKKFVIEKHRGKTRSEMCFNVSVCVFLSISWIPPSTFSRLLQYLCPLLRLLARIFSGDVSPEGEGGKLKN